MATPDLITITDAAVKQMKLLLSEADNSAVTALKLGVKPQGCSGMKYDIAYATPDDATPDVIEKNGLTLYIAPDAVMYLLGSEIDYQESDLEQGFQFKNPNEKSRCGCGESFYI